MIVRSSVLLLVAAACAHAPVPRLDPPVPRSTSVESFTNVVYVVAGTGGKAKHQDVLWRVHARVVGARDTSRYWEGVTDIAGASDAARIYADVADRVCTDAWPRAAGGLGARNAYLVGFSRGAMIVVRAAREVKRRCNAHVAFIGLVDAVNTSITDWPTAIDSSIPSIHLVKTRAISPWFFDTTPIAGAPVLVHPDPKINHDQLVCPVGHERDADGSGATWTESQLIEALGAASTKAGAPITFGAPLPPSCPPGWRKYF